MVGLQIVDGQRRGPLSVKRPSTDDLSRFDGQGPTAEAIRRILAQQGNVGPQSINDIARAGIDQTSPNSLSAQIRNLAASRADLGASLGADLGDNGTPGGLTTLLHNISSQIGRVASEAGDAPPPVAGAPTDDIMERLYSVLEATSGGIDTEAYEKAMADQRKAIRQGYRGQIKGRKETQRLAQERGEAARGDVDAMYRALANTYKRAGKQESTRAQRAAEQVTDRAAQSEDMLARRSQERDAELVAIAEGLGAEGLTEQAIRDSGDTRDAVSERIAREAQQTANRLASTGEASARRMRGDSMSASHEGGQTVNRMREGEEDYVRGLDEEIAALRAARRQDISGNRASVAQTIAGLMGQSNANMFNQALQLAQFQHTRESDQANRAMQMMQLQGKDPLQDARIPEVANYESLMANLNPEVQAVVSALANSDDFGFRKGDGGIAAPATVQSIAAQLRRALAEQRINATPEEMSDAIHALMNLTGTIRYQR